MRTGVLNVTVMKRKSLNFFSGQGKGFLAYFSTGIGF
jgi:hypothetical protein